LSDVSEGNLYTVAFPMAEENNGNGTVAPAFALPGGLRGVPSQWEII